MSAFGRESGAFTDRGFVGVDPNGFLAKFATWVVKTPANHGPGWFLLDDQTSLDTVTTDYTNVNISTERITINSHGIATGRGVLYSQGSSAIGGLTTSTVYYVIRIDENTISLATTEANAISGTAINLTSQGSGTHSFTPQDPFIIVSDVQSPTVNAYNSGQSGGAPKFLKCGYSTSETGYVRFQAALWHDVTTHTTRGFFSGKRIAVGATTQYAYYFAGGAECLFVGARLGTIWNRFRIDDFVGISSILEGPDKVGVLQSAITAGSNVVLQLATGQAANFTVNKFYYLYDFDGHTWCDYVKVTARDTGTDQITVDLVTKNFPSGAVVAAYAHRYYAQGNENAVLNAVNMTISSYAPTAPSIPYYSYATKAIHTQTSYIYASTSITYLLSQTYVVDDENIAVCTPFLLVENYNIEATLTGMNRIYGRTKNLLCTKPFGAQMMDYRTVNGIDYINEDGGLTVASIFRYSESLT